MWSGLDLAGGLPVPPSYTQIPRELTHWDVGRIHRSDLAWLMVMSRLVDREDPMRGIAPTSVGFPVERLDAHLLHPRRNVLAADLEAWSARSTAF